MSDFIFISNEAATENYFASQDITSRLEDDEMYADEYSADFAYDATVTYFEGVDVPFFGIPASFNWQVYRGMVKALES